MPGTSKEHARKAAGPRYKVASSQLAVDRW